MLGSACCGCDSVALIDIQNLRAGYGRRVVLDDLSLLFEGGAAGLLGPNGAGKSTLLKILLGFLRPFAGKVEVLGYRLPRRASAVRARIGYMPETEAFIPGITGVALVAYMAELSGLPRRAAVERAHEVLQYVGIGEQRYRNMETYSTGMKQRVKLAQAIVHDPALLLLDEPTNGMDPQGRIDMLDLVADLSRNKGMSVILSSHLLKDVETVCSSIFVIAGGRIVARRVDNGEGSSDAVRTCRVRIRGNLPQYIELLRERGGEVIGAEGVASVIVQLRPEQPSKILFEAAEAGECIVQRVELITENIEDMFVEAMGELGNADL